MIYFSKFQRRFWCAAIFWSLPFTAFARNDCFTCKTEMSGGVFIGTDQISGLQFMVCSNCVLLPRCFLCGAPVKINPTILPDGRQLCERDAKSVVLDAAETRRICTQIKDDLDRQFSRFATFPSNVDVDVIDRIDAFSLFHQTGFDFESPNLLGCIRPVNGSAGKRYWMQLMTGQTPSGLKATCAHEFSHAWAGENIPSARRRQIARDAEEGFCEMVAYLLMDAQHEDEQKKIILRNRYTRGQVYLFIEAERRFGLDQILDWMRFGNAARLEPGRLEAIRDVTLPVARPVYVPPPLAKTNFSKIKTNDVPIAAPPLVATFKLEGIFWDKTPQAIINGRSFVAAEAGMIKLGRNRVAVRCLAIEKNSVRLRELDSGIEHELQLP
jgi:hypothetical protein